MRECSGRNADIVLNESMLLVAHLMFSTHFVYVLEDTVRWREPSNNFIPSLPLDMHITMFTLQYNLSITSTSPANAAQFISPINVLQSDPTIFAYTRLPPSSDLFRSQRETRLPQKKKLCIQFRSKKENTIQSVLGVYPIQP